MKKFLSLFPGNKRKPVWGQPLAQVARVFGLDDVPIPIVHAIDYLNNRGLRVEGIYRVPGNLRIVELLKKRYDNGEMPDLNEYDAYVVSGLVKNYFSSLPDPLMTYELYDSFLSAQALRDREQRLKSVQALIQSPLMPPENRKTLARLVSHLRNVAENSEHNKMSLANLSIVFGPTLFRSVDDNPIKIMTDTPLLTGLVQCLIVDQQFIFNDKKSEPGSPAPAIFTTMPSSDSLAEKTQPQLQSQPAPTPSVPIEDPQHVQAPQSSDNNNNNNTAETTTVTTATQPSTSTTTTTTTKEPAIDYDNVNEEELQLSLINRFGGTSLSENTAGNRKGRTIHATNTSTISTSTADDSILQRPQHANDDDVNQMIREIIGEALHSDTRFSTEFDMLDQRRLDERKRQSLEQMKRLEQEFGPVSVSTSPPSTVATSTSSSTPTQQPQSSPSSSFSSVSASTNSTQAVPSTPTTIAVQQSLEQADSDRRKRRQYSTTALEGSSKTGTPRLTPSSSTTSIESVTSKNSPAAVAETSPVVSTNNEAVTSTSQSVVPTMPIEGDEKAYLKWLNDNYPLNLANPLPDVQRRIILRRTREGRTDDLSKMTLEQLKEEKSLLKKELRNFDKTFEEVRGQEPTKRDKEPLREVYKRYKLLKSLISAPQRGGAAAAAAAGGNLPATARRPSSNTASHSSSSQRAPQTAR